MPRKKAQPSVWEKLNEPVPEPSKETFNALVGLIAVALMFTAASPYFGHDNAVYRSAYGADHRITNYHRITNVSELRMSEYVSFFAPMEALASNSPRVAGAKTETGDRRAESVIRTPNSEFYNRVAGAFEEAEDIYQNGFMPEYKKAFVEVFDISEQLQPLVEFYEPGVSAAWNAWLELMADPVILTK